MESATFKPMEANHSPTSPIEKDTSVISDGANDGDHLSSEDLRGLVSQVKGKKQKNPKTPESTSAKAEKKGKKKAGANTSPQNSKIQSWRNYNNVGAHKKYQQVPPKSTIPE
jgi:hypothetical protein